MRAICSTWKGQRLLQWPHWMQSEAKEDFQCFPDVAHRPAQIGVHHIKHPVVVGFVDDLLFADTGVVDENIHITKGL